MSQHADDAARIPRGEHVRRHVLRHDRARADRRACADRHARKNDRSPAHPAPGADPDSSPQFRTLRSLSRVDWVRRGVDVHAWTEEDVVADLYAAGIEDHAIEVRVEARADEDVAAVVAVKRWLDPRRLRKRAEQKRQDSAPAHLVRRIAVVELAEKSAAAKAFGDQLG